MKLPEEGTLVEEEYTVVNIQKIHSQANQNCEQNPGLKQCNIFTSEQGAHNQLTDQFTGNDDSTDQYYGIYPQFVLWGLQMTNHLYQPNKKYKCKSEDSLT